MTTRTPPELKWLLVERATLAGDLANLKARLNLLEAEISQVQSTVQALDAVIRLTESRVRPDAAGVIRRHQPKYGTRGGLKAFIVDVLQGATIGMTTRAVAHAASRYFELQFVSEREFTRYQSNTVRSQLYQLAGEGLVTTSCTNGRGTMLWTWKRGLPTLAELALLAGAVPASTSKGAVDGDEDPSRHQVAHQRDSHATG